MEDSVRPDKVPMYGSIWRVKTRPGPGLCRGFLWGRALIRVLQSLKVLIKK